MKKSAIIASMMLFILFGCLGESKIDGTSEETFKKSVEQISEKLNEPKREEFKEALKIVAFSSLDFGELMKGALAGQKPDVSKTMAELNGLTADQVISQSKAIIAEREAKMRKQALQEIAELEAELQATEKDKQELAKFEVVKSRFYKYKGEYDYKAKPIIELKVKNGTAHPISRIYCNGVLASPGRSIPWLEEQFNYEISGGLEPGETGDWSLAPNVFSEWGKVDAPKDAILTVTVYRLDGPGGDELFSSYFPESKMKRLSELKEKYGQ